MWSHQYPSAQTQISNSVGSPSTTCRLLVAVNVLMPAPTRRARSRARARPSRPAGSLAVHEAEPLRCRLRLGHPRPEHALHVLHRRRGDLVREPHALDLLRRLDHPRLVQQRRRVLRVRERVEPRLRERRRLADHAIGRLRSERELEPDRLVLLGELDGELQRAQGRRPWVVLVIPAEQVQIRRPRRALGVLADGSRQISAGSPSAGKTTASYPFMPQKFVR